MHGIPVGAKPAMVHNQFMRALNGAGSVYVAAEAAKASPLAAVVGPRVNINVPRWSASQPGQVHSRTVDRHE
jgi:hypothetical protein